MHKEVVSIRPEEALCGQEKILKHGQRKKQIYDEVNVIIIIVCVDI